MAEPALSSPSLILLTLLISLCFFTSSCFSDRYEGPWYDSSAYTECKRFPEAPLYQGGILRNVSSHVKKIDHMPGVKTPAVFSLLNLTQNNIYAFSCWVKIRGADTALIRATFSNNDSIISSSSAGGECVGSVLAKQGCWSFLKGGFVLDASVDASQGTLTGNLFFQSSDAGEMNIFVVSASLQPFTSQQWKMHQDNNIRKERKRTVNIHVSDTQGERLTGAVVSAQQISKDFPFGSAIAKTIIGNQAYQDWFAKRFNAAVFENELKWYATEREAGNVNYTLADQMLSFVRSKKMVARGHNIFWEDPLYTPPWVRNLTGLPLRTAVQARIQSLLTTYTEQFLHWDVSNEMLHFDFYEQRLGPNASVDFFRTAQDADPHATLFLNDFNVIETCGDAKSAVDAYVLRLRELKEGVAAAGGNATLLQGIGLEGHFRKPNLPFMRAVLDKLATLGLPIWLTEVDISKTYDQQTQAVYLEQVLREGFSHPAVDGMMLWTALHPNGCYQMCLTDNDLQNLPAGDVVDKLLQEWQTQMALGHTDDHGSYIFDGFLGEYMVFVVHGNTSVQSTFSLSRSDETKHLNIQLHTD